MLDQYTYVFAIGTFFALLDAYNNGASKYSLAFLNVIVCTFRVCFLWAHNRLVQLGEFGTNQLNRRCRQRLGYLGFLALSLLQTSYDLRYHFRDVGSYHCRC